MFSCRLPVFLTLLMVGCHGVNSDELDFTRVSPNRADVVGTWVFASANFQNSGISQASHVHLHLLEDTTFSAVNLPTPRIAKGEMKMAFSSGIGKWAIRKEDSSFPTWVVDLLFEDHHMESFHLRHQQSPYLIHLNMGDPDTGRALLLHRTG